MGLDKFAGFTDRYVQSSLQVVLLRSNYSGCDKYQIISDSGRLTFIKETAGSQERLELRATNAHQTMSQWLLFAKKSESSQL